MKQGSARRQVSMCQQDERCQTLLEQDCMLQRRKRCFDCILLEIDECEPVLALVPRRCQVCKLVARVCTCAVTGIVLARLGAHVVLTDLQPNLALLSQNCTTNGEPHA